MISVVVLDRQEMAGWLVLTISKDFGFHFGSLGDAWEMAVIICIRTPTTTHTISTTTNHTVQRKTEQMAGCLAVAISNTSGVDLNQREMAGRWLGGCPRLFPKIAGDISNLCKMVGS